MTLIELVVVIVIVAFAASGLSFSIGALTRTNLKSSAAKVAAAARYAYNRAVIHGATVRIAFEIPGKTFSIEEAHARVTLARADDDRRKETIDKGGADVPAVDPWAAAKTRISDAMHPTYGASPFHAIADANGKTLTRYQKVALGRRIQFVKLIVAHEPAPREQGKAAVHFFSSGTTEHAVIQLSDGGGGVYSVEIKPLTGRSIIHAEAYEPKQLIGDPRDPKAKGEVDL